MLLCNPEVSIEKVVLHFYRVLVDPIWKRIDICSWPSYCQSLKNYSYQFLFSSNEFYRIVYQLTGCCEIVELYLNGQVPFFYNRGSNQSYQNRGDTHPQVSPSTFSRVSLKPGVDPRSQHSQGLEALPPSLGCFQVRRWPKQPPHAKT